MKNIFYLVIAALALSVPSVVAAAEDPLGGIAACSVSTETLGSFFCRFQSSTTTQLITLVCTASFIVGLFLVWRGLGKLARVAEVSSQEPLSGALMTLGSGVFLTAFPATIMMGLATLGSGGVWQLTMSGELGPGGAVEGDSFIHLVANFAVNAAGPLSTLVMALSVVIGLFLVASSLTDLSKINSPNSRPPEFGAIVVKFGVGLALVNIYWLIGVVGQTFGISSNDAGHFTEITARTLSYSQSAKAATDLATRADWIMRIALAALIPFGLIAFVRGLLILKDSAAGTRQVSMAAGFTHIVGGVALVNVEPVSCAIMATFGVSGMAFCTG